MTMLPITGKKIMPRLFAALLGGGSLPPLGRLIKPLIVAALALVLVIFPACGSEARLRQSTKGTVAVSLAVGNDCPPGVLDVLTDFCDSVYAASSGSVALQLQHWTKPFDSDADLVFERLINLRGQGEMFKVAASDFIFTGSEQMNSALNAESVQEILNSELLKGGRPYSVYSSFYCGKAYILTGDNEFLRAIMSGTNSELHLALKDIRNLNTAALPFKKRSPEEDRSSTVYYSDTEELLTLPAPQQGFKIVDSNAKFLYGLILVKNDLSQRIPADSLAYLLEGLAAAKPACDNLYVSYDDEIAELFGDDMVSSRFLRTAVRALQEENSKSPMFSPFAGVLEGYER